MSENNRPTDRIISIRLLPEEAEVLQAKAQEAGMTQARFLKNAILQGAAYESTFLKREDIQKMQYEIDKIGNNINQISYYLQGDSDIDEIDVLKLRDNYMELLSAFYDFIHGKVMPL